MRIRVSEERSMCKSNRARVAGVFVLLVASLASRPALAQFNLSGD